MNDKDFDKLLQESIREYGHTYFEETPENAGPPHMFPADFLRDVPFPPKKPSASLRIVRIISALAAALVLLTAVFLVPAVLSSRKEITAEQSRSIRKETTAPSVQEKSPDAEPSARTSLFPVQNNAVRNDSVTDSAEKYEASEICEEFDPVSEPENKMTDVIGQDVLSLQLPSDYSVVLMWGDKPLNPDSTDICQLCTALSRGIAPEYQTASLPEDSAGQALMQFELTALDTFRLQNRSYCCFRACVTAKAVYLLCSNEDEEQYYLIPADNSLYTACFQSLSTICANIDTF